MNELRFKTPNEDTRVLFEFRKLYLRLLHSLTLSRFKSILSSIKRSHHLVSPHIRRKVTLHALLPVGYFER